MRSLEDILLEQKHCSEEDINQALNIQKEYGGTIGNILLNTGTLSDKVLIDSTCKQYNLERFDLNKQEKSEKITIKEIPTTFFSQNKIYPLCDQEDEISFVTHDPIKVSILSFIKKHTSKKIAILLATEEELRDIKAVYDSIEEEDDEDIFEDEVDKLKELASEAPVIKLVNNIFTKAVQQYVSDIHFESYKLGMKVRYRVDGILKTVDKVPQNLKQAITARLKLISKMNISENRLPQDGRISIKVAGQEIDIRSSSVPTAFGESFVLRLLGSDSVDLSLDNMGFHKDNLSTLKEMLKKPNGIILTTGPTGSGKTSTLYAALNYIHSDDIKIITVEDPVEYQLEGISQIQVKSSIDYTFANALRSILRQDPDVIMIGEIRDSPTAKIAIQSALTGHLVLSTLHTNSALGAVARLLDMDMEYFLLKSSVVGLMAQRLARRLCPTCKQPAQITQEQKEQYNIEELKKHIESKLSPSKPKGCQECNFTGYKGRVALLEILPFDDKLKKELDKNPDFNDMRSLGYRTLQDDGVLKFLEGKISLDEVIRLV